MGIYRMYTGSDNETHIGELPTLAAPPAVVNAVMDALSQTGVRHIDTPLSSEKVWRALNEGKN